MPDKIIFTYLPVFSTIKCTPGEVAPRIHYWGNKGSPLNNSEKLIYYRYKYNCSLRQLHNDLTECLSPHHYKQQHQQHRLAANRGTAVYD